MNLIDELRTRAEQRRRELAMTAASLEVFRMSRKQASTFMDDFNFIRQMTAGRRIRA